MRLSDFSIKRIINQLYDNLQNQYFRKKIITYTAISSALFIVFSISTTLIMSGAAINHLTASEQKMMEQSENTSDYLLRNINYYVTETFENNMTILDGLSQPYSPTLSYDISSAITYMKNSFSVIDSVYLFNETNNLIYTGDAPAYSYADFPDPLFLDYITDAPKYAINRAIRIKTENEHGETEEKNCIISVYKLNDNNALAVCLDSDRFDLMINTKSTTDNRTTTIFTSEGTVMSSTDKALFGTDMSNDEIYLHFLNKDEKSGTEQIGNKLYFYRKGSTLDTLHISYILNSDLMESFVLRFIIILLFGLVLAFILLISNIRLGVTMYHPLKRLHDDISDILNINTNATEIGTAEDLSILKRNLSKIRSEYVSMQSAEMRYNVVKRSELVYSLLCGAYNFDMNEPESYNIKFPYAYSTVAVFRLDNTSKITPSDVGLILYAIENIAGEIIDSGSACSYATSYGNEYDIMLLINHSSQEFDTTYFKNIQKYIRNIFAVSVTVAYDSAEHDINMLAQLYHNAEYAMQYRLIFGHSSIIPYASVINDNLAVPVYPANTEREILKAVTSRNTEQAAQLIHGFTDEISRFPYMYIIMYISNLYLAIEQHFASSSPAPQELVSDSITKLELITEMENMLISRCTLAAASLTDMSTGEKHDIIAMSIRDYIDNNYTDPNLSIHVIAAFINKSANYTRNIFKQSMDISISEYITQKRFNEVCRMLRETNLTAQAIASKVGMMPGSYFYTAFKKYTGVTPEQYRRREMQG